MKKIITFLFILVSTHCFANVKLATIFTDNMVLQANQEVAIFGSAKPNEKIEISFGKEKASCTAKENGYWIAYLPQMDYCKNPQTLKVKGQSNKQIQIENVLVGQVWLCTGQSNMSWRLANSKNAKEEIENSNLPLLRYFTVPSLANENLQDMHSLDNKKYIPWTICSPETSGKISGVGYFFGKKLLEQLDVPIGLIVCSYGASAVETWYTNDLINQNPDAIKACTDRENYYKKAQENYDKLSDEQKAKRKNIRPTMLIQFKPQYCYNAMVNPIVPYTVKGAIWYQGEANANSANEYKSMYEQYVNFMRKTFKNENMPYYSVQLASYKCNWMDIRQVQKELTNIIENTNIAVTIDVGEKNDIHPKDKKTVGNRLALLALKETYNKDIQAYSPQAISVKLENEKIIVKFDNSYNGLKTSDDNAPRCFEVKNEDQKWFKVDAKIISKDEIALTLPKDFGNTPMSVRYAWEPFPLVNLYNSASLPVFPFKEDIK